jgi:hypothetical protein
MGGAILAAPVLLPLLWWTARTGRWVRVLGAILAALVVGEVAWAGVYLVVGERQPYIWALPALAAAVTLWLMLVTTSINPRGSARPAGDAATAQPRAGSRGSRPGPQGRSLLR